MRSKPKSSEEAPAYEPISWNGDSTIDQVLGSQEVASLERVDSRNRKDRGLTATVVVSRNHRLSLQAMRRKPKAVCVASYTSLAEAIRGLIERTHERIKPTPRGRSAPLRATRSERRRNIRSAERNSATAIASEVVRPISDRL